MQRITPAALVSALVLTSPVHGKDDGTTSLASRARLLNAASAYDSFQISGDGGASLEITGYMLTRYVVGQSDGYGEEDTVVGFDQPRIRLGVKGSINDTFGYKLIADYSGDKASLADGYITAKLDEGLKLTAGQFIQPFTREQDVSSSKQTAVERSIANSFFTVTRSQGVMLEWKQENLRWRGAFNDGAKADNTEYLDEDEADYGLTTRVEYLVDGSWGQFKDFQGWQGGKRGLLLGGAVHYQSSENSASEGGGNTKLDNRLMLSADVSAEFSGASAMAAVYYMDRETDSGDFTDLGFVLQGGVMTGEQTEIFARFDSILADSDRTDNEDLHTLTAGMNYFFMPQSHAAKLTVDVQHVFSDLNDTPVSTSSKRTIHDSDDAQTSLRVQFVLRF